MHISNPLCSTPRNLPFFCLDFNVEIVACTCSKVKYNFEVISCFVAKSNDHKLCHLRWRVSKLIFARVENKLFLVWRSEEPAGCQLPCKLMGYMKGVGLPSFALCRALRERSSPRIVSNRRYTMLAKLNTYTDYFMLQ